MEAADREDLEQQRLKRLDPDVLAAERRRFCVERRGGVYFPISG